MKDLLWSLDIVEFELRGTLKLHLEGWICPQKEMDYRLDLLADENTKIPCDLSFRERPDLAPVLVGAVIPEKPGFIIYLDGYEDIFEKYKSLKLLLSVPGEEEILWEKECNSLKEMLGDYSIICNLEKMDLQGSQVVVQGWAFDAVNHHELEYTFLNEKGESIPYRIARSVRLDVNKAYHLKDDCPQPGFNITIRSDDCRVKTMTLHITDGKCFHDLSFDMKTFFAERSKKTRLFAALNDREKCREVLSDRGFKGYLEYLHCQMDPFYADYGYWRKEHSAKGSELKRQKGQLFPCMPLISIVIPLYNTPAAYLKVLMDSLVKQTYRKIEICLADGSTDQKTGAFIKKHYGRDPRVRYQKLSENKGISENTNAAVKMASGDFIMLSDHDDVLEPDAVFEIVKAINLDPSRVDIVYTDEDKITMDGKLYFEPNFKPDFNLDLLQCNNYICHIFAVRRTVLDRAGLFCSEFDGAQDYDLILRCVEKADRIEHVPKILYHWRCHPASTAENPESKFYAFEAGRKALQQHYDRLGIKAKAQLLTVWGMQVFGRYRTVYELKGHPMISIIIPNKDHIDDLDKCLKSIREKSTYDNYEVLVVENNSTEPETFRYYEQILSLWPKVRVIYWKKEFNYAAINNFAVSSSRGEYLLLLNNDTEIITPEWMEEMLGLCQRRDTGAVGAKLYFPDETIQHAGVIIGLGGIAGHIFSCTPGREYGYQARLISVQQLSAVTAACMMIKKSVFDEVGGFDEAYQVAFNDIDLCMKISQAGKKIVFTPFAELIHYESKTRGREEETPRKMQRFLREVERFEKKWPDILKNGDPFYSPSLALDNGSCTLRK